MISSTGDELFPKQIYKMLKIEKKKKKTSSIEIIQIDSFINIGLEFIGIIISVISLFFFRGVNVNFYNIIVYVIVCVKFLS